MVADSRMFVKIIPGILGTGSSPVFRIKKTGRNSPPPEGGSYGNKILYKNLKFFDRFSCENLALEDFVWGKNLVDGEILCLGMISEYLYTWYALLCGGDTKFKLPKAGNGNVFFPNKRVRFARADKAVALQYHNQ